MKILDKLLRKLGLVRVSRTKKLMAFLSSKGYTPDDLKAV
jgi:hypothetical protein